LSLQKFLSFPTHLPAFPEHDDDGLAHARHWSRQ
jgi:hypothetical protein